MSSLSAEDLGVSEDDVPADSIGFMYVYDESDFTVMMMLFPAGVSIPNHDHPLMTVFSKVLFGEVEVSSFDPRESCKCGHPCFDERFKAVPVDIRRNREARPHSPVPPGIIPLSQPNLLLPSPCHSPPT